MDTRAENDLSATDDTRVFFLDVHGVEQENHPIILDRCHDDLLERPAKGVDRRSLTETVEVDVFRGPQ
ncbi:hypothetical protein D3C71_2219990 [compost metagenome]